MAEALLLAGALFCSFCGMAWFALAKPPHWQQARGARPLPPRAVRALHVLGAAAPSTCRARTALAFSFGLCLWVDHISMASLVWVMTLPASALLVAFTLAWQPRWLAWLVAWMSG